MRRRYRALRSALAPTDRRTKNASITARVQKLFVYRRAEWLLAYAAIPEREASPCLLIMHAWRRDKRVAFPRSNDDGTLTWLETTRETQFKRGAHGIFEPAGGASLDPMPPNAVALVPGVAFTRKGARLGQGRGYFDRFLAEFEGTSIGLAYECQIVESLPLESHDRGVDFVVTEDAVYP